MAKIEVKSEDDIEGSSNHINSESGVIQHPVADQDLKYESNSEEKPEITSLASTIKEEHANENQSNPSIGLNFMENCVAEFCIKKEEINIKSEDDIGDPEHFESQNNNPPRCNKNGQTKKGTFYCEICSTKFSAKHVLVNHRLCIHGEGPQTRLYKCDQCTYITGYKHSFARHVVVHKNILETKMYKCSVCDFKTKYKRNLKGHSLTSHVNKDMLIHQRNSEVQKIYNCHVGMCPYMTTVKTNMKLHEMTHKNISELPTFDCYHCKHKAKRKADLICHMKKHKNLYDNTSYKCSTCSFHTIYKSSLLRHLLIHQNELDNS